ncbi:MAG: sel1 repeat family protein [Clostridiales bacterium]|nr:sel1 repeat family protein [Clostridiales bacterium]
MPEEEFSSIRRSLIIAIADFAAFVKLERASPTDVSAVFAGLVESLSDEENVSYELARETAEYIKALTQPVSAGLSEEGIFDRANECINRGDYKDAYKIIEELVKKRHPRALNFLGTMYRDGLYFKQDYKKAFEYFTEAVEGGEARALANLGSMYYNGQYVQEDITKAVNLWRQSAEMGSSYGQIRYGLALYWGSGVDQNYAEAAKWYEKAGSEDPWAMQELGMMYIHGVGVPVDTEKGLALIEKAAVIGFEYASAFLTAYNTVKSLIPELSRGSASETDTGDCYVQFHNVIRSDVKHDESITAKTVLRFAASIAGDIKHPVGLAAEYSLLLSLAQYLYYEAPANEQHLFMIVELIEAAKSESGYESVLERLFGLLAERDSSHVALKNYEICKKLSGNSLAAVVASCRKMFNFIGGKDNIFEYIQNEDDLRTLAKIILVSFGDSSDKARVSELTGALSKLSAKCKGKPVKYADLGKLKVSAVILRAVRQYVEFYQAFGD